MSSGCGEHPPSIAEEHSADVFFPQIGARNRVQVRTPTGAFFHDSQMPRSNLRSRTWVVAAITGTTWVTRVTASSPVVLVGGYAALLAAVDVKFAAAPYAPVPMVLERGS